MHSGRPLVLRVGKPIPTTGLGREDRDTLTLQAHDAVATLLEEGNRRVEEMLDDMSAGKDMNTLERLLAMRFAAHPWHGVPIGDRAPEEVTVYVEIVPTDAVKYELDKGSGHLRIDRPQLYSSFSPTLYGFIPQTYCGAPSVSAAPSARGEPTSRVTTIRWTSACSASAT